MVAVIVGLLDDLRACRAGSRRSPRCARRRLVAARQAAEHDDPVAGDEELAVAQVGQLQRGQLARLVAGDVVGREHVVLDAEQLVAGHLHDVGLVDAGLLHVGAGLVVGRADRGRHRGGFGVEWRCRPPCSRRPRT